MNDPAGSSPKIEPAGRGDHMVKPGECLLTIAAKAGHYWETVWKHDANAPLREARDPFVLYPGDRVTIPPKRLKTVTRPPEQTHRFKKRGIPYKVRMRMLDGREARSGQPWKANIGPHTLEGQTDGEGVLEFFVPPGARTATLTLGSGETATVYQLEFARLDPPQSVGGAQSRLNALGYDCGTPDGVLNVPTRESLAAFQARHDLPETGELDEATINMLVEVHGS